MELPRRPVIGSRSHSQYDTKRTTFLVATLFAKGPSDVPGRDTEELCSATAQPPRLPEPGSAVVTKTASGTGARTGVPFTGQLDKMHIWAAYRFPTGP